MKTVLTMLLVILFITPIKVFPQETDCATVIPAGTTLPQSQSGDLGLYKREMMTNPLRLAIHIIRSSGGQGGISSEVLETKLQQLYNYMEQANFSFRIYSTDYIDNDIFYSIDNENEIIQLMQTKNINACINVYFVPLFPGYNGVATFSPRLNNTGIHGIIVKNNAWNTTLPHEMGHFFDLFHTYETLFGYENIARTGGCANWDITGDLLKDTPADPSGRVLFSCIDNDCNWNPKKPLPADGCGQTNYSPLTNNLMTTELHYCRTTFTQEQKNRMNETLLIYRSELLKDNLVYIENRALSSNAGDYLFVDQSQFASGFHVPLDDGTYNFKTNKERFPNLFNTGINFKHNNWNNTKSKFYLSQVDPVNGDQDEIANFDAILNAKIQVKLEGNLIPEKGSASFLDPWYVLSDGSQPGNHWIHFISEYEPTGREGATEKGVFLNQTPDPNDPYKPYYNAWAGDQLINLGSPLGVRQFYLQNWTAAGADLQTFTPNHQRVVFTSGNAVVQANFKGQGLSNNQNAYINNSQRKVVRTGDGTLHKVYESMGYVWYERSTDNGTTWTITNSGKPISSNESKHPAIDILNNSNDIVGIVWQERNGDIYKIKFAYFFSGTNYYTTDVEIGGLFSDPYSFDAKPVIAWGNTNEFLVVWREQNDAGLHYRLGAVYQFVPGGGVTWWMNDAYWLEGTDANSNNPTIATRKDAGTTIFHLAWQYSNTSIKSCTFTSNAQHILSLTSIQTPSDGCGYTYYENPSISITNGNPRLVWVGKRYIGNWEIRVVNKEGYTSGTWSSTFQLYGSNVASPTRSIDIIAWSENNGGYNKCFRWGSIKTFGTLGRDIQLSNAPDYNNMRAVGFRLMSPYFFYTTPTVGSLSKENNIVTHSGRGGIVNKDSSEFYFTAGDILLDGDVINFADFDNNISINNTSQLTQLLTSEPFQLNSNSEFKFSVYYGVRDSLVAINSLTDNDFINYKIQLIDFNTEEILGEFDNVTFTKNNILTYANSSYQVSTLGMGNRNVILKLIVNNNFEGNYSLVDITADQELLEKTQYQFVAFNGHQPIESYELAQNYPNPFNPTTVIKYQIPEDGIVKIKIYDILGKEVKTLVNEQKTTGKYEINFDASNLASGVYIYKIQVNDFISSRKMMLLK